MRGPVHAVLHAQSVKLCVRMQCRACAYSVADAHAVSRMPMLIYRNVHAQHAEMCMRMLCVAEAHAVSRTRMLIHRNVHAHPG